MEVLIKDRGAEKPLEASGALSPRGAGEVIVEGGVVGDVLKAAEMLGELEREDKESVAVGTSAGAGVWRGSCGGDARTGSGGVVRGRGRAGAGGGWVSKGSV